MGTKNSLHRRTQADPIRRRMYALGRIEGIKARVLKDVVNLPDDKTEKDIDAMIADAFAVKTKAKG